MDMGLFGRKQSDDRLAEMLERASSTPSQRVAFYAMLMESILLVPGERIGATLDLRPYDVEGRSTLLLFSSERYLTILRDRPPVVPISGSDAMRLAAAFDGIVLNYGSRIQKAFTRSEIDAILSGTIGAIETGDAPATIIGQPKEYPLRLMEELRRLLPRRTDVDAAYIAQITRESEAPRIILAFETTMNTNDFATFRERVAALVDAVGTANIDVVQIEAGWLSDYLHTECEAFYRRHPLTPSSPE